MRRRNIVSKDEIEHFKVLQDDLKRLCGEMLKLTPETPSEDRERLLAEYGKKEEECNQLEERIKVYHSDIARRISQLRSKSDGTDLKAFDEDIRDFADSLNDYYESRKEQLYDMLKKIEQVKIRNVIRKLRCWWIKRTIRKEIMRYDSLQEELNGFDVSFI